MRHGKEFRHVEYPEYAAETADMKRCMKGHE